jgi:hypothetical protein
VHVGPEQLPSRIYGCFCQFLISSAVDAVQYLSANAEAEASLAESSKKLDAAKAAGLARQNSLECFTPRTNLPHRCDEMAAAGSLTSSRVCLGGDVGGIGDSSSALYTVQTHIERGESVAMDGCLGNETRAKEAENRLGVR